jgi:hypothetical protein
VRFVLVHWLAVGLVVCVAYHVEPRYLTPLLPFHAIAVGGALARIAERVGRALPVAPRFWIAGLASMAALALGLIFTGIQRLGKVAQIEDPCARAVRFVRERIGKDEPILTNNPWFVSWKTERPGVMAPTNGDEALITVIEHYGTRWALALSPPIFVADLVAIFSESNATTERLRPERVLVSGNCAIYRLHGN